MFSSVIKKERIHFRPGALLVACILLLLLALPVRVVHAANPDDGISTTSLAPGTDGVDGSAGLSGDFVEGSIEVSDENDEYRALGYALGILLYICQILGEAVFIWGIIQLISCLTKDEPPLKKTAIITVVTGAVLFSLYPIFKAVGFVV